jgi:peroxiredoxin
MLRFIHPLTSLGSLLFLVAPGFLLVGEARVGLILFTAAYGLGAMEFKKYTSDFQFVLLLAAGTAMGITIDLLHHAWPLLTLSLFSASLATIVRQKYMQQFTYINLLWLDSGLALVATALLAWAIADSTFAWSLWLPPLLPICAALFLTANYVQDGLRIRRSVAYGYQVKVGQKAPAFTLPDADGAMVALDAYRGKHPVLLVFVRGDWCPGCHMMLRTYERNRQAFLNKGVHVLGIGPDDISVNKEMVERIGVGFRMLSDSAQKVSRRYGVVYNNPAMEGILAPDYAEGIPLPASFLVDVDGTVRYVSRPERVGEFLDPARIFPVLEQLPTESAVWTG